MKALYQHRQTVTRQTPEGPVKTIVVAHDYKHSAPMGYAREIAYESQNARIRPDGGAKFRPWDERFTARQHRQIRRMRRRAHFRNECH